MTATLYLFPDTNLFLQCKPIEQLDWSVLGVFESVELVLTRPVQAEIDSLKSKGNSRQAGRARSASTQIRELLKVSDSRLKIRDAAPSVYLHLDPLLRPDPSVAFLLDYEARDDQLVGIALGYQNAFPGRAVWLLTHDTGPMASAKAVGLTYQEIPETWLLAPEAEDSAKREAALKTELDAYKRQEPKFTIAFDQDGDRRLVFTAVRHVPLTAVQVQELVDRLRADHPMATDFGETEPRERTPQQNGGRTLFTPAKEVFSPATLEDIDRYRQRYDEWIEGCAERLGNLAQVMQAQEAMPRIQLSIENTGSRPADDALVVCEVQGRLYLCPPEAPKDDAVEKSSVDLGRALPRPPTPPAGRWTKTSRSSLGNALARIADFGLAEQAVLSPSFYQPTPRDPNALYFKVGRRGMPMKRIEYECAQWRHAQPSEQFVFDVWFPLEPGTHGGIARVSVHAANLTRPQRAELPISITVTEVSCFDHAKALVEALDTSPQTFRLAGGLTDLLSSGEA